VEPTRTTQQEEKEREKEKGAQRREEEVQGSKAHAARTGMYGALTREIVPWQPWRLSCKRFGVKDPNVDITTDTPMPGVPRNQAQGQSQGGNAWKAEEALAEADLQTATGSANADPSPAAGLSRRTACDLENIGLGEDNSQGRDTLTYVRLSMDIFKAIFARDDEDSDDEPEEGGGQKRGLWTLARRHCRRDPRHRPTENKDHGAIPAHLRAHDPVGPVPAAYEPRSANRPPPGAERVDVATFKPVFVPRAERETQKLKDKKDGRGKDKKKAKVIVSFEDDDDSGAALAIAPQADKDKDKSRKKKKRRKEKEMQRARATTWRCGSRSCHHELSRSLSTRPSLRKGKCSLRGQLRHLPHRYKHK
jgi:G patch domain-containing protein 1